MPKKVKSAQTKLIRVDNWCGCLDVIVDSSSKQSYLWSMGNAYLLTEHNLKQSHNFVVPRGMLMVFVTLDTKCYHFMYKCDNYYNAQADGGIAFD